MLGQKPKALKWCSDTCQNVSDFYWEHVHSLCDHEGSVSIHLWTRVKCKFWLPTHTQTHYHFEVFYTAKTIVLKMKVDAYYIILTGSSVFL